MHKYKSQKHQKRIKDQAIDLCKNEAGKKKEKAWEEIALPENLS